MIINANHFARKKKRQARRFYSRDELDNASYRRPLTDHDQFGLDPVEQPGQERSHVAGVGLAPDILNRRQVEALASATRSQFFVGVNVNETASDVSSQASDDSQGELPIAIQEKSCLNKFVIPMSSQWYQTWRILNICIVLAGSFFFAYQSAFLNLQEEEDWAHLQAVDAFFEWLYAIDMGITLFVEFKNPVTNEVEREFSVVVIKYIRSRFAYDFIATFPIVRVLEGKVSRRYLRLLYWLKLSRLVYLADLLLYKNFMKSVRLYFQKRLTRIIKHDPRRAKSQKEDQHQVGKVILIGQLLKTFQLAAMIFFGSYFAGLFYFAYCDLTYASAEEIAATKDPREDNFMLYFDIYARSNVENMIMMTYFSFTSLSTVGLGDYHPRGNKEWSIAAFMMIIGVLLTSVIMDNLNRLLYTLNETNKGHDEDEQFHLFMNVLKRYNGDQPLQSKFQEKLERYFCYRWKANKTSALLGASSCFRLLPDSAKGDLLSSYLFKGIRRQFCRYFYQLRPLRGAELEKGQKEEFECLMTFLLRSLEPIRFDCGEYIAHEGSKLDEFYFLEEGSVRVGYDLERWVREEDSREMMEEFQLMRSLGLVPASKTYPAAIYQGSAFGAFELLFQQKSRFRYRAAGRDTAGLFIRKRSWGRVASKASSAGLAKFRKYVFIDYMQNIHFPMRAYQKSVFRSSLQNQETDRPRSEDDSRAAKSNCQVMKQQMGVVLTKKDSDLRRIADILCPKPKEKDDVLGSLSASEAESVSDSSGEETKETQATLEGIDGKVSGLEAMIKALLQERSQLKQELLNERETSRAQAARIDSLEARLKNELESREAIFTSSDVQSAEETKTKEALPQPPLDQYRMKREAKPESSPAEESGESSQQEDFPRASRFELHRQHSVQMTKPNILIKKVKRSSSITPGGHNYSMLRKMPAESSQQQIPLRPSPPLPQQLRSRQTQPLKREDEPAQQQSRAVILTPSAPMRQMSDFNSDLYLPLAIDVVKEDLREEDALSAQSEKASSESNDIRIASETSSSRGSENKYRTDKLTAEAIGRIIAES